MIFFSSSSSSLILVTVSSAGCQGHETCALLILEKISDRNLVNCTNAALQTYVDSNTVSQVFPRVPLVLTLRLSPLPPPPRASHLPPPCRPLHVAARKGLTVVVQELLGKGASVLAVDENGESADVVALA